MRAQWWTFVVLASLGCSRARQEEAQRNAEVQQALDAWNAHEDPKAPPIVEAPAGPPLPPLVSNPESLSEKYLVILQSSPEPGVAAPSLAQLEQHPELLAGVVRASSSWFKGLAPCYEITVAGAFEYQRQASTLARQLDLLGVDNYVKGAGRYVGRQETVDAWCRRADAPAPTGCEGVRFAEVHDGAVWLPLLLAPESLSAALEGLPNPTPLGGLDAWAAPIPPERLPRDLSGSRWKMVAPASGKSLGSCKIAAFAALTSGHPHFGYLQQQPPPTAPSCGEAAPFARLDCKKPPDEPLIAVPRDAPDPVLFTALAPLRDIDLEDDVKAMVNRAPGFSSAFAEAREAANERSAPLQQLVSLTGYVAPGKKVLAVRVTLQTGDGEVWCGADDVRVDLLAVYDWPADGGLGEPLVPLHRIENTELLGLIDLEDDGVPELVERAWPDTLRLERAGQEPSCELERAYCDCPC